MLCLENKRRIIRPPPLPSNHEIPSTLKVSHTMSPQSQHPVSKNTVNAPYRVFIHDKLLFPAHTHRYLATCSADATVRIWSIGRNWEFRLEKVLVGHQRWVWDCGFSADSAYLITGAYIMNYHLCKEKGGKTFLIAIQLFPSLPFFTSFKFN